MTRFLRLFWILTIFNSLAIIRRESFTSSNLLRNIPASWLRTPKSPLICLRLHNIFGQNFYEIECLLLKIERLCRHNLASNVLVHLKMCHDPSILLKIDFNCNYCNKCKTLWTDNSIVITHLVDLFLSREIRTYKMNFQSIAGVSVHYISMCNSVSVYISQNLLKIISYDVSNCFGDLFGRSWRAWSFWNWLWKVWPLFQVWRVLLSQWSYSY